MKNKICINFEENWAIFNILNEICHGFHIDNFVLKIGITKEEVKKLFEKLRNERTNGEIETYLTASEVKIIQNALTEVEKELEGEFSTRVGMTECEVHELPIFKMVEPRGYKLNFENEQSIIHLLLEICRGLRIDDFESKVGVTIEEAEELLKRLLREKKAGYTEGFISISEIQIIKNALKVVEQEIEEWEFSTRFGVTLEEVKALPLFKMKEER